jgi:solute carrier family 35 protein C2
MGREDLMLLMGHNLKKPKLDGFAMLAIRVALYIILFFLLSISLSVFNSYIFSKKQYDFNFPLFIASMHALLHFYISIVLSVFLLDYGVPSNEEAAGEIEQQQQQQQRRRLYAAVACGVAAGLDIGISNYSLRIVSLSFYTMVKSSTPIFILIFSMVLGVEKLRLELVGIILLIGVGVFLTSWSETQFQVAPFLLVLSASLLSGVRWTLTQTLLKKSIRSAPSEGHPIRTMRRISPIVSATLFCCFLVIEGAVNLGRSPFFSSLSAALQSVGIISCGAILSFCLIMAEFKLIAITSVVTLSVSGILKEILTISVSILLFHDKLHLVNIFGLVISIIGTERFITGIIGYNIYRYRKFIDKYRNNKNASQQLDSLEPSQVQLPGANLPSKSSQ